MKKFWGKGALKKAAALLLAGVVVLSDGAVFRALGNDNVGTIKASAATAITSLEYYDGANGPNFEASGVDSATFGFVMPKFNGKSSQELSLSQVEEDLELQVWQEKGTNGKWKNINEVTDIFLWNSTWAWEHQVWSDTASGWIVWFKVTETTKLRFHGKTNNVNLEYSLKFNKLAKHSLSSISAKESQKQASTAGGSGIDKKDLIYNNNESIIYDQVADDIEILVKRDGESKFVPLFDNAASGWIYDQNFGVYTDGNGGWWFNENASFTVRFQHKNNSNIRADIKINWTPPDRSSGKLTAYDGQTTFDARSESHTASVGLCLPKINGEPAIKSDIDKFTFEICVGAKYNNGNWSGGNWVELSDVGNSGWLYQGNGYSKYSAKSQWGYWIDTIWGLWFQPVKDDVYLRVGYPSKPLESDAINGNYVYYTIIGDPQAVFPDLSDMTDIEYDTSRAEPTDDNVTFEEANKNTPDGWKMIWHDEFNGNSVNRNNWTNQTGFLTNENDIGTAGWGNNELEWYTDSDKNTSVSNGKVKFTLRKEIKEFSDTQGRKATALYSSGKLISQHKFSVKYGRVDFRAKLPDGVGIWPALWMMPNDDVYGTWASSGEIDIMEGRGRTPYEAFGTVHYGGTWPGNLNTGNTLNMVTEGNVKTDMTDWHIYSLVWEEGTIRIYADGKCYFKITSDQYFSAASNASKFAPFDQRFYLIMNLAVGGWFDGGRTPDYDSFTTEEMYVDYVRVYQRNTSSGEDEKNDDTKWDSNGRNDGLYGDYKMVAGGGSVTDPGNNGGTTDPGNNGGTTDPGNDGGTTDPGNNGGTTDPGNNGGTTDPGNNGGTTDPGNNGGTTDPGNNGGTTDPGNNGGTTDPGNNGGTTDPGNNGGTTDPGNNGGTTDPGNNGGTTDPGNNGGTTDPGNNGGTTDPGNNGGTTDPGNNGGTTDPEKKVSLTGMEIKGISKKIAAGKKIKLTVSTEPANASDTSVTWQSSNTKYATVDANGVVKTKKAGKNKTVTIRATAKDGSGVTATYKIKIMPKAVKKIVLKAASKTVKAGKKIKIKATVTPNLGKKKINKKLAWTSSNKKYATVNSNGVVKTKKAGKNKTVKITAKATDGSNKKKTIKIKIK